MKLIFVPHIAPLDSLIYSLPHQSRTRAREIIKGETNNPLIQLIEELKEDNQQWIIFMDQFEEIFTLTPPLQRDQFITNLELLIRAKHLPVKLIIAMRSDFIDRLRAYPNFIDEVEQSRIRLIKDLRESELRLAIAEPAARNGVTFAKGLVEQIISDFHQQAGSLPLLQYTLDLLWRKDRIGEDNRVLQSQTYTDLSFGTRKTTCFIRKNKYPVL